MNSDNNSLHQTNSIQQKSIKFSKSPKPLAFLTIVLLVVVTFGIGGYWLGTRTSQISSHARIISQLPSPTTINYTTVVIIQDDYFFKVTIPPGYALTKGKGDYIRYVKDSNGEEIIGFYISSGFGESLRTGQIVIDDVPFTVEGEINTYSKGAVGCSADLYATNAQFKLNHFYFGIHTWCRDIHEKQSDVYERIIRSIQFSKDLRTVLLGKSPPPILRH